ncbi:Calx-beta domain-containing protein [Paenibacillus sepulcri]|uniref:Calx-beta domain-containing protein n=1 Tax=Paenibacillus sepulcri TaxID=359917 RepID=A0ABS7BZJ0_9BACL|nr:hypothetical protein [Paenibacillus sepulcri]
MGAVLFIETRRRKIAFLLVLLLTAAYIVPISQSTIHAEGQSTISFETNYIAVKESDAKVNLKIVRTNGFGTARAFYYANGGGKWLSFAPGETSKTITFPFQDDSAAQGNRMLKVYFATNYIEGASFGKFTSVDVEVLDDDGIPYGPGKLTFERILAGELTLQESAGYASLIVQRKGGTRGKVTVNYKTSGYGTHSAQTNVDYKPVSGTFVFEDGESWKRIDIPIIDNDRYDGDRLFVLTLSGLTGGAAFGSSQLTISIQNDDPKTNGISFATNTLEFNEDDGYAFVDVLRDHPKGGVIVKYIFRSESTGIIYGDTKFVGDETKKTIRVPITDDQIPKRDETIYADFPSYDAIDSHEFAYISSPDAVSIHINDNDSVHFEFKSTMNYAIEESGIAMVSVIRSGSVKGRISVNYTTAPVSATDGSSPGSGSDYIKTRGQLIFGDGETVKNIQVPLVDDSLVEYNEKFRLYFEPDWLNENRTAGTFTEVVIFDKDRNES